MKRRIRKLQKEYAEGQADPEKIRMVMNSYNAHLMHGDTYHLRQKVIGETCFTHAEKETDEAGEICES